MKKVLLTLLIVISLICVSTVVSFAATYGQEYDFNLSQDYNFTVDTVTMKYETGGFFTSVKASTTASTSINETGYVYAFLEDAEGTMNSSKKDFSEGTTSVNSGNAKILGSDTAVRVVHYVIKTAVDNSYSYDWEYTIR